MPLLILLIVKGTPFIFTCLVFLLTALGLAEFYRMALPQRKAEGYAAAVAGSLVLVPLTFFATAPFLTLFALSTFVLCFMLVMLFRIRDIKQAAQESALLIMGILYIPLLLGHLALLRSLPFGTSWILLLLIIVMCGDSAAYYCGTAWGKTRLYPEVSPKKSVEGSIGGLFGSIAGALVTKATIFPQLTVIDCLATAVLLGVLGQLGDLFESLLKRSCGVKDSGTIFPGHGGVLDRLDSILFAAPACFYYAHFVFRP